MKLFIAGVFAFGCLLLATQAQAQPVAQALDATTILGMLQQSMLPAINTLSSKAISWLGVLATLQFFITNYGLLKTDADIQAVIAKLFGAVAWVGIVIFIINNGPQFIGAVGDQFFGLVGLELPSPGSIVAYTIGAASAMSALAVGVGAIPLVGDTAGMLLVYLAIAILAVGMYFAFKIFMLQLELGLIVMLSPLSFALLGLSTLKDQGIAPFKALLSLAYRIILLTVILSAFSEVSEVMKAAIASIEEDSVINGFGKSLSTVLAAMGAYLLLCYLVFKSDSIAGSLASGGTSMGTGDVAQAAAAGAAMGAAVASGGAVGANIASSAPNTMRDFMGSLMGGGSVRNASAMGSGAEPPRLPAAGGQPSMSIGSSTSGAGPARGGAGSASSGASVGEPSRGMSPAASQSPSSTSGSSASTASDQVGTNSQAAASGETGTTGSATAAPASDAGSTAQGERGAPPNAPQQSVATGRIGPDLSDSSQPIGSSTSSAPGQQPVHATGSGSNAGITGDHRDLSENLGKLVDHLSKQAPGSGKPRLADRLSEANRQMERESSSVHVSVNAAQHD